MRGPAARFLASGGKNGKVCMHQVGQQKPTWSEILTYYILASKLCIDTGRLARNGVQIQLDLLEMVYRYRLTC